MYLALRAAKPKAITTAHAEQEYWQYTAHASAKPASAVTSRLAVASAAEAKPIAATAHAKQ